MVCVKLSNIIFNQADDIRDSQTRGVSVKTLLLLCCDCC